MATQHSYSLRRRMLMISSVVLVLFISLAALILDQAFKKSLQTDLQDRLQTRLYLVLGATEFESDRLRLPSQLNYPNLNQLDSGIIAAVLDQTGEEVWRSASASFLSETFMATQFQLRAPGQANKGIVSTDEEGSYFFTSLGVAWEIQSGGLASYTLVIAEKTDRLESSLSEYRMFLWIGLGILGLILLAVFTMTLVWGLSPLNRLADDLKAIESGRESQLTGFYPLELKSVTQNLNLLLQHEKRQHTRYRNTLANLAHSLKTPLAVMRGVVDKQVLFGKDVPTEGEEIDMPLLAQQVNRMDDIVQHQLKRATHVGPQVLHQPIAVFPMAKRLSSVIQKVHQETLSSVELDIDDTVMFKGAQEDFIEILGNLLDNAGKYGGSKVQISAVNENLNERDRCRLTIEDNGPGIPEEQVSEILKRGVRADQKHQGQGIGLAMVVDIVDQYEGQLHIVRSKLGGAKIEILL